MKNKNVLVIGRVGLIDSNLSQELSKDNHASTMLKASIDRYINLLFCSFYRIRDHLAWEEEYYHKFPECIITIKNKE